jgi:4-hydroxyphenylpyruvate dioxygenase
MSVRKSIATVSLSGTLREKLAAIAEAGFDGIEIFENDLVNSPLSPQDLRRRAAALGLAIELYQPFRDFEALPEARFAANLRRAERKFDLMDRLGATTLLVCSNVSPDTIADDALAAQHLHALAERAAQHGIALAYEALAWGRHVSDYEHSWRIVKTADHSHLGVCLDSFHILSRDTDPAGIRKIPGEKIAFLQLADAPRLAMDVLQWSRHYRCFPGQGGFDLAAFLEHVAAAGYRGPLSLEVFNDTFRQSDAAPTAVDAMRSLLYLEERLHHRLAATTDEAAARERLELFAPPAATELSGTAFTELAADDEGEAALAATLGTLGFTRAGRHRTKQAELWRHGAVHLVINREEQPQDGPRLSVLGLQTADTLAAADRAEAYLAPLLPRRRSAREADLPSVRIPGGATAMFCPADNAWLGDFDVHDTGAASTEPDPVLTDVDHVALPVSFDEFDDAILFLRAVLGLNPAESLELADPYGLVRSRALTAGDVRIALNLPPGGQGPARPHHIAFASPDIFAAARTARQAGAPIQPIPDNYYDDLLARCDLDEALIVRMRDHNILYDRDGEAEFFHYYTELVGPHLFFEVVQRTGGYAGYGAANAPTRMAAQHPARRRPADGALTSTP